VRQLSFEPDGLAVVQPYRACFMVCRRRRKHGRSHINFQDWDAQENPKEAAEHLALICKEVREKTMPPLTYRILHKEARLSEEDNATLCAWSQSFGTSPEPGEEHHH